MSDINAPSPDTVRNTSLYSKPKKKASSKQKHSTKAQVKLDKEILWQLVVAADGHLPTVAGVVDVTPRAIGLRLAGRYLAPRWRAWKATQSEIRRKGKQRRGWWRWRLRGLGIDPLTLDERDPTWAACWCHPRGALVRAAVDRLRADGVDVRTPDGILRVLDVVAARVAAEAAARRRLDPGAPDDGADVPDVPDDGADDGADDAAP